MRREIALFFCAVQFLTRVPVPSAADFAPDWISRCAKYFPLVGQCVGLISAGVLLIAAQVWGGAIPAVLAIAAGIAITGAFHEDGLADTADGLGGGRDRVQRLTIMKDSRLGTYGAVGLGLALALKISVLATMPPVFAALGLVLSHGVARAAAVIAMHAMPYAGDPDAAKVQSTGVTRGEVAFAVVLGLWPLLFLPGPQAAFGLLLGAAFAGFVARKAKRLIGGQTGDVLGAIEQVFEIGFLLGLAALTSSLIP